MPAGSQEAIVLSIHGDGKAIDVFKIGKVKELASTR
jgi:hypothetical protein